MQSYSFVYKGLILKFITVLSFYAFLIIRKEYAILVMILYIFLFCFNVYVFECRNKKNT